MPGGERKRVAMQAFKEGDVYIDYPFEDARFRREKKTGKVFRYFLGEPEVEIDPTSKLFHEAISGGWWMSAEDYFRDRDVAPE